MRSSAVPLLIALTFVSAGAAAAPCDLTGPWIGGGTCQIPGGSDYISQTDEALTFTGENGGVTHGSWGGSVHSSQCHRFEGNSVAGGGEQGLHSY